MSLAILKVIVEQLELIKAVAISITWNHFFI